MKSNGRPLVPYMRQSRLKERTISIEEQRRDIQAWAQANGVTLAAEVIEHCWRNGQDPLLPVSRAVTRPSAYWCEQRPCAGQEHDQRPSSKATVQIAPSPRHSAPTEPSGAGGLTQTASRVAGRVNPSHASV
jgi:hypothetical protein